MTHYLISGQAVGITLRSLIQSVDEILPSLHSSVTTEVHAPLPLSLFAWPHFMSAHTHTEFSIFHRLTTVCDVIFPQIEGTKKLLNKDLGELINKMRLAQQNSVTSLREECQRQMLAAAHTLALDSKNLLDAVDQARVRANLAKPKPDSLEPGD